MVRGAEGQGWPQSADQGKLFLFIGTVGSFIIVVTVGLAIAAIGLTESKVPAGATASGSLDGAEIYSQNCAVCHGDGGEGGIGPQLAGVVVEKYPDINVQMLVVEQGRRAMPGFGSKLSPEQIEAVVSFEREGLGAGQAASE